MRLRWVFLPIEIAGRYRWCETVRIVQRYEGEADDAGRPEMAKYDNRWHDAGFWDEVYPSLVKATNDFAEL